MTPAIDLSASLAYLIVAATVAAKRRADWRNPITLLLGFLAIYIPFRGLVLLADPMSTYLPARVQSLLATPQALVAAGSASVAICFVVGTVALFLTLVRRQERRIARDGWQFGLASPLSPDRQHMIRQLWYVTLPAPFVVAAGLWHVTFGSPAPPSVLGQIANAAMAPHLFAAGLLYANDQSSKRYTTVAPTVLLGLSVGSKDLLLQVLIACLFGAYVLGTSRRRGRVHVWRWTLASLVVLLFVLPIVQSTRVDHSSPLETSTLSESVERPSHQIVSSLRFITDRLHGFDSLLIGVADRGDDPALLNTQQFKHLPLAVLSSETSAISRTDPGIEFSRQHWGNSPESSTSVAPSIFAQALIGIGYHAFILASLGLAIVVGLSDALAAPRELRLLSSAAAFILVRTAADMERDIISTLSGALRSFVVLFAVWLALASWRKTVEANESSRKRLEIGAVTR